MGISAEWKIKLPNRVVLDEQAKVEMAKVVMGGLIDNILKKQQADGSPLKTNSQRTLARKRREGKPGLSLVDEEHRFIASTPYAYRTRVNGIEVYPRTAELVDLIKKTWKRGYVGWFGLSAKTVLGIKGVLKKMIKRIFARRL